MTDNLIEIKNLAFSYGTRPILNNVNMAMSRGKVIAVMGGVVRAKQRYCV